MRTRRRRAPAPIIPRRAGTHLQVLATTPRRPGAGIRRSHTRPVGTHHRQVLPGIRSTELRLRAPATELRRLILAPTGRRRAPTATPIQATVLPRLTQAGARHRRTRCMAIRPRTHTRITHIPRPHTRGTAPAAALQGGPPARSQRRQSTPAASS